MPDASCPAPVARTPPATKSLIVAADKKTTIDLALK
jgi:hypothetical protein